jgi:ribonuclease BN (tRNA processing enzyme)
MDHNASFFHFAITSWMYGRRNLSVYGPEGTEALIDALVDIYHEDLEYRREFGRPTEGITDIEFTHVSESFSAEIAGSSVTARPVEHTIPTFAYRIEDESGTAVYSADTGDPAPLEEFAANADILVQNCGLSPVGNDGSPADHESWHQYLATNSQPSESPVAEQHCTPEQAATVGAEADVDTLVLTHLLPAYDRDAIISRASRIFDGAIHIAEPGLTVEA